MARKKRAREACLFCVSHPCSCGVNDDLDRETATDSIGEDSRESDADDEASDLEAGTAEELELW